MLLDHHALELALYVIDRALRRRFCGERRTARKSTAEENACGLGQNRETWRYAAEAEAERNVVARRVSANVVQFVKERPEVPVHCVQDGVSELPSPPHTPRNVLPQNANVRELVGHFLPVIIML